MNQSTSTSADSMNQLFTELGKAHSYDTDHTVHQTVVESSMTQEDFMAYQVEMCHDIMAKTEMLYKVMNHIRVQTWEEVWNGHFILESGIVTCMDRYGNELKLNSTESAHFVELFQTHSIQMPILNDPDVVGMEIIESHVEEALIEWGVILPSWLM